MKKLFVIAMILSLSFALAMPCVAKDKPRKDKRHKELRPEQERGRRDFRRDDNRSKFNREGRRPEREGMRPERPIDIAPLVDTLQKALHHYSESRNEGKVNQTLKKLIETQMHGTIARIHLRNGDKNSAIRELERIFMSPEDFKNREQRKLDGRIRELELQSRNIDIERQKYEGIAGRIQHELNTRRHEANSRKTKSGKKIFVRTGSKYVKRGSLEGMEQRQHEIRRKFTELETAKKHIEAELDQLRNNINMKQSKEREDNFKALSVQKVTLEARIGALEELNGKDIKLLERKDIGDDMRNGILRSVRARNNEIADIQTEHARLNASLRVIQHERKQEAARRMDGLGQHAEGLKRRIGEIKHELENQKLAPEHRRGLERQIENFRREISNVYREYNIVKAEFFPEKDKEEKKR